MKNAALLICLLLLSTTLFSQSLNLNDPLPDDTRIKKGVLKNGMTYYLHSTDVSKDVASFYIFQNVGSVLENDNQRGLAHFLEHMAFNGTESFPGKGILNTLEEHGLIFGRDINAYTSFDETVYNINNIPSTPELLDTGLTVLHDWCNYLLLTDEEIDAERGVIKEEWRQRQSGQRRMLEASLPTRFNNTKYADRWIIGLMPIIENFEYKTLRDFYHDWYRTDLQAIAIVGDFDIDEMEQNIIAKFSKIPAVENPIERFLVKIPDNDELQYQLSMDEEVATSRIIFSIRHDKSLENETVKDLKEGIIDYMISQMLSARITELSQDPEAPFLQLSVSYSDSWARLHNDFSANIYPKPNNQQASFKAALTEINRAVKFGFTKSEIKRTKAEISSYYENQIAKIDDASHKSIINTMQSNYFENAHMTDIVKEFELVKNIFSKMSSQEIQSRLQEMYTDKNRIVMVTGVEGNQNITKEEVLFIINEVENDVSIQAYVEEVEEKSLMDGVELNSGTIISSAIDETTGATVFELSNGITVNYKFVDKNKNEVKLQAISDGGKSLLADSDLASNEFLISMVQMSGLGEFSMTDLPKLLAGKTANSSVSIGATTESVNGSSSTKDVETMLQLVNLRFTHPRFDENSYDVLMQNIDSYLIRKTADLNSKKQDSITTTLYGNNEPKKRLLTKEYVAESSFETMKSIYQSRFSNAADFKFFIVGDVNEEELIPLLEKYIASIPTSSERENWVLNKAYWNLKKTDRDIYLEMEDPKASVNIAFKSDMEYSLKDAELLNALGAILQLRFTETLREDEGGTYGANSYGFMMKEPKQIGYLSISFDCNPDKVEDLIKIVYKEIEALKKGEISQADLDKTLTNSLKDREDQKNYNSYEMSLLKNYVLEGFDMNDPDNFENIINSITIKDIQDVAKRLLDDAKSFEIVFKPKIKE